MTRTVTIDCDTLERLAGSVERHHADDDYGRGCGCSPRARRLDREAVGAARAALALVPRPVEGCVVGGCTDDGALRWPTLDGDTVPVCQRHHDMAASYVDRNGLDDEEALWRAGREGW